MWAMGRMVGADSRRAGQRRITSVILLAMTDRPPVADWATDFDHTHADYAASAPEIWEDLRETCPVAHTERFGGCWFPVDHDDVSQIAKDTQHFTSESIIVSDHKPQGLRPKGFAPPITSDPPFHADARRILLPAFAPKAVDRWRDDTRSICHELIDDLLASGDDPVDAAIGYTRHIPVRVIAKMLGLPESDGDKFREFIRRILEEPGQNPVTDPEETLFFYLSQAVASHRAEPKDDLIGFLLEQELGGAPLTDDHIGGTIGLILIAGIDTTWSALGASLWHLAQTPEHRQQLVDEPDLMPVAVEEFLRYYAPVSMARIVAEDVEVGDVVMKAGDWTLLPFPAANRDPKAFENPHDVILDREHNRHLAFGLGIHRCVGSNLARMEMNVALEVWMERIPDFELDTSQTVRWSTGQVRGPRELPLHLLRSS